MILETFSLRLNWAPDGNALIVANSLQPPNHCAAILRREHWDDPLHAVGHKGAVTVVSFNPVLFSSGKADDTDGPSPCYALGAQVSLSHLMLGCLEM